MLNIDIRTVLYLLAVGNILSVLLLLAYYGNEKEKNYEFYLLGKIFQSMAWILINLRGEIPDLYSADVGNSLLFLGFSLEALGFVYIHNNKNTFYLYYQIFVVFAGSISFWFFAQTLTGRVAIASTVAFFIYSIVPINIFTIKKAGLLHKMIGLLFTVFCLILLVRAYTAFTSSIEFGVFSETIINPITFYTLYCSMFTCSLGQVFLLKQKSDYQLKMAATMDPLTGVFNRRAFNANAKSLLSLAVRNNSNVSILMLDLDNFKSINDKHGHSSGDLVLVSFAKAIKKIIRPHDVFGRLGGEEFCLTLICQEEDAIVIAERIRIITESQKVQAKEAITYTVSIGAYSAIPCSDDDLETMISKADDYLYQAKESGRNRVCAGPGSQQRVDNKHFLQLIWNKGYNSGETVIDRQHRALFEKANILISTFFSNASKMDVEKQVSSLIELTRDHFLYEENLLKTRGYPELSEHKKEHDELLAAAESLSGCFHNEEADFNDVLKYITQNLVSLHIIRSDTQFFPWLQRHSA